MSAINVNQTEASVLVDSLKMFAKVHETASGVVPKEVAALLSKLAPEPMVVVEEVPAAAVAAFMDDVPHEQFTEDAEDEDTDKPSEDE